MRYDAFISYNHTADGELAPAIRKGLQQMARPWNRRQALRIFLDESGLAISEDLWESIHESLDQSRFFILLASPDAATSRWVNRELKAFLARETTAELLPVVTHGEWVWDDSANDFDWRRANAVPRALQGVYTSEPRHLDLRWVDNPEQLDLANPRFRDAIADIAAPIHGVAKDEIESEDIRQHRRFRLIRTVAVAALAALAVTASVLGVVALLNAKEADRQTDLAIQRQAEAEASTEEAIRQRDLALSAKLLNDANDEMRAGHSDAAILLSLEAFRLERTALPTDPATVSEATKSLLTTLTQWPQLVAHLHGHDSPVTAASIRNDARQVASADRDMVAVLWDVGSAGEVAKSQLQQISEGIAISDDGRYVASAGRESIDSFIEVWNVSNGTVTELMAIRRGPDQGFGAIALNDDGNLIAALLRYEDGTVGGVALVDRYADAVVWSRESVSDLPSVHFESVEFSGTSVRAKSGQEVFVFDIPTGSWTVEEAAIGTIRDDVDLPGTTSGWTQVDDNTWAVGWSEDTVLIGSEDHDIVTGRLADSVTRSATLSELYEPTFNGSTVTLTDSVQSETVVLSVGPELPDDVSFGSIDTTHAFSEDGALFAAGGLNADFDTGYLAVWDVDSENLLAPVIEFSLPGPAVYDMQDQMFAQIPVTLEFSPDGELLVAGLRSLTEGSFGFAIAGWMLPSLDEVFRHQEFVSDVDFGTAGGIAYVGEDGVHFGRTDELEQRPLPSISPDESEHRYFDEVGISQDESLIATTQWSQSGNMLKLWDTQTERLILTIPADGDPSLGQDTAAVVLRWAQPEQLFELKLDAEIWLDDACSLVGRTLTQDEWTDFIGDGFDYEPSCEQ